MKKVFIVSIILSLFFLGCHKDGVYNPKEKIKRVYSQWPGETKMLEEEWTWDKKLLTKIDYYWNNTTDYSERFTYEKKRLVKMEASDGDYINIKYDGKHFDKMEEFSANGQLTAEVRFKYDKNKISKMEMTFYEYYDDYDWKSGKRVLSIMEPLFPPEFEASMKKMKSNAKNRSVDTYTATTSFTYEGNNVKEMKHEYHESGYSSVDTYTYIKYDKKSNPKYRFIFGDDDNGLGVTSKNNPTEILNNYWSSYYGDIYVSNSTTTYDYTYDGKFPIEVYRTYRDNDGNTSRYTIFYEYQ